MSFESMTDLIQIYLYPLLVLSLFISIHCLLTSHFPCGHSLLYILAQEIKYDNFLFL